MWLFTMFKLAQLVKIDNVECHAHRCPHSAVVPFGMKRKVNVTSSYRSTFSPTKTLKPPMILKILLNNFHSAKRGMR